jgi:hypothetical protein
MFASDACHVDVDSLFVLDERQKATPTATKASQRHGVGK